ncbi:MAG: DUF2130 domain-containing protein [Flavobacteriaceae bacterium]|jgi:hypothetical protein|nr:DUF2130 domain-containing protein [Flavobacteriaceae bacterium]
MNQQAQIQCPNCGAEIDVNNLLKHQVEESIKKEYQEKFLSSQKEIQEKNALLKKEKEEFEAKKKRENEFFQERLNKITKEKTQEIETSLKKKIEEETKERFSLYEKELAEKSEKLQEFNKLQAEILKLNREKEEMRTLIEFEAQKKLNEELSLEREKIRKQENEKTEFKVKELQKQLEDQKRLTEEMKRKQEQISTQLQGEIQELAIEEWLAQNFPLDTIDEVKKGIRGADCLQIVNTRDVQNCGSIYYESKRTKDFQSSWIEKFKNDIREKKAHIGVLVTEVMPPDMERMGMKEGIWICTFEEFKGLSAVLRHSVIQFNTILRSQENKGDKMGMLYDFLTGNEFKLRVEGIVEGFSQMQEDLAKEKRLMTKSWAQREKQIEKVIENTISMYGSIKGIAGNAIQSIKALELDSENELGLEEN